MLPTHRIRYVALPKWRAQSYIKSTTTITTKLVYLYVGLTAPLPKWMVSASPPSNNDITNNNNPNYVESNLCASIKLHSSLKSYDESVCVLRLMFEYMCLQYQFYHAQHVTQYRCVVSALQANFFQGDLISFHSYIHNYYRIYISNADKYIICLCRIAT